MSENQEKNKSYRVFPKRISEKEYAKGQYLPNKDLHHLLDTLSKLRLQNQDDEGNTGFLVAKKPKHPNTFYLIDSKLAQQDLSALIPLTDYLEHVQKMPNDMCDLEDFEYMKALNPQQFRSFIRKAIINGLTYTDKDGQEKALAQFYTEKLRYARKNIYGICVPNTTQGQKALLELAGFTVHTCDISEIGLTEREKQIYEGGIKEGKSLKYLGYYYNVSYLRVREIAARMSRKIRHTFVKLCSGKKIEFDAIMNYPLSDKDALYIKDSNGDCIITQKFLRYRVGPLRSTCKSKQAIIRFDRGCRTHEE